MEAKSTFLKEKGLIYLRLLAYQPARNWILDIDPRVQTSISACDV